MNEDRLLSKLDAIESKTTQALVEIAKLQEQVKDVPDHENRLRALEKWRWALLGAAALLSTAFTFYSASKGTG